MSDITRAEEAAAKGRWRRAAFLFERARAGSLPSEQLESEAIAYFRSSDFGRALELFLRAAELRPQSGTLFNAGAAAEQLGLRETARGLYEEALGKNQSDMPAALGLARIRRQQGDYEEELDTLLGVRGSTQPVDIDVAIMNCLHRLGRSQEAMAVYHLIHGLANPVEEVKRDVSKLHADLWKVMLRNPMSFGAGGFYQSMPSLQIPGMRPTERRFSAYDIGRWLDPTMLALDIGCNHGFMALSMSKLCKRVEAFDSDAQLIECASIAKQWMRVRNVIFSQCSTSEIKGEFDFVLSCAVHQWIDLSLPDYAVWLASRTRKGGHIVFESNDLDAHDRDFDDKATYLRDQIGEIVHTACDYDDRFYRRKAVVIVKTR